MSCRSPDARRGRAPRAACALRIVTALVALAALASGCADRPRSNPLDPGNPSTGGGPTGFVALAENGQVELRWNRAPARADLLGFLLERRRHGPNVYVPVGDILVPSSTGALDLGVSNDLDYDYRLSYVAADTSTIGVSVLAAARPGPEVGWVADAGADEAVRLTPDTRARFLTITGVRSPNRLALDAGIGTVWASEPFDGRVKTFEPDGTLLVDFPAGVAPNAMSIVPGVAEAWVCDEGTGRVARFTVGGTFQLEAGVFQLPTDIVATPDGGAWMVDQQSGKLYRFDSGGATSFSFVVGTDPRRVALDAQNGTVWVTCYSAGEAVHVDTNGDIVLRVTGLDHPYGIDVDEVRGRVWIGLDGSNSLRSIDRSTGALVFDVAGISRPRGLQVVDRTGECWVAAVASGEVVRVDGGGLIAQRTAGFAAPLDVRVVAAGSVPRIAQNR